MPNPEIIEEKPTNLYEIKEILDRIKKRDKELNIRAGKTEEYIHHFTPLSDKKAQELIDKLNKLDISRLKEQQIHKIVDLLPESVEDVKLILQGYTLTLSTDHLNKLVELVKPYVPKKR